ncbi:aminoglycoside phosphotransferase family protein [Aspergillus stella-maris]|uniref:aminoglycoside phosphotransferase family protein n=1 Tax=Aspergillus stella-maris TaxID=1810926 RepID=UPI003CCD02D9
MDLDDISLSKYDRLRRTWMALASKSSAGIWKLANQKTGLFDFSIPGKSMLLDEKVQSEAILMEYITKETSIPVPKVMGYGTNAENPTGLGPFIIMTWIGGTKMSDLLKKPDFSSSCGSLGKDFNGQIAVTGRPLTCALNELIRVSGLSSNRTPQRSTHLEQQRNSVYDSQDCRNKYACRHLMKAVALNFTPNEDNKPFRLFCDDLHPGNILVDDSLHIMGVFDWEFTYVAPSQFASDIPWWLLLRRPDSLVDDLGPAKFLEYFLPRAAPRLSGARIADRVRSITSIPDLHRGREDFDRSKIKQLQDYYKKLGEEYDVEYEPEQTREISAQATTNATSVFALSSSFFQGAVADAAVGLTAMLLVNRWYRT